MEEPELYLHPHARRIVSDRLDSFCDKGKNQVIVTTHNTEFIKSTNSGLNIVRTAKIGGETIAESLNLGHYQSLFLDDKYREIFFADAVIICEGFDEYIIKLLDKEKYDNTLDRKNYSIISVGGKDNFSKTASLINKLGTPCYILSDFDYLLRDKSPDANQYKIGGKSNRHESLENLTISYFKKNNLLGEQKGQDIYAEIKSLRSRVKKDNEKMFYTASALENININLQGEIKNLLSTLRKAGVCILTHDIEDLWIDGSLNNKFDQNEVFKLNSRILNGEKLTDIIDASQLEEFLSAIFLVS